MNYFFLKILNKVKFYILGWINSEINTEEFYSSLAKEFTHRDQVDGYVKKFGEKYLEDEKEWISHSIIEIIENKDKVIDIGCGTGRYLNSIKEKACENNINIALYGIDLCSETIKTHTKKNCSSDIKLQVENIIQKRPFEGETFNLAYCISIIQHIPFYFLGKMFDNISKLLEKEAYFYLVFPHHKSLLGLFLNPRYTRYKLDFITKILLKKGFKIINSGLIPHNRETNNGPGMFVIAKKVN